MQKILKFDGHLSNRRISHLFILYLMLTDSDDPASAPNLFEDSGDEMGAGCSPAEIRRLSVQVADMALAPIEPSPAAPTSPSPPLQTKKNPSSPQLGVKNKRREDGESPLKERLSNGRPPRGRSRTGLKSRRRDCNHHRL
jgi:hypothetical protein